MSTRENWPQTTSFNRPPRDYLPPLPTGHIDLPAPPTERDYPDQNALITILPVLGIGVLALFYLFRAVTDASGSSALFAIPMLFLAVFTVGGTLLAHRWRVKQHEAREIRAARNYRRLLETRRARLQAAHDAQRALLQRAYPEPDALAARALSRDHTLWERRPEDADFMTLRIGRGPVPCSVTPRTTDPDNSSPALELALQIADTYRTLPDAPVTLDLKQRASVGIYGQRGQVLGAVRAMICRAALDHAPGDLQIYLVAPQSQRREWHWLNWLPHTQNSHIAFDTASIRNLTGSLSQSIDARRAARKADPQPHLMVIIDEPEQIESEAVFDDILRAGQDLGASALCLVSRYEQVPGTCQAALSVDNDNDTDSAFHLRAIQQNNPKNALPGSRLDVLGETDAATIARALAGLRLPETGANARIPQQVPFLDLYGVRQADDLYDPIRRRWQRDIAEGALPFPTPIGRESLTTNMFLMLDEDHHGPHGVLAGTTGAGKSELMQTLVCALALEHDPRLLNLLLIDFKGGSTFRVFDTLPHTVGMVTNLDGELVRRALEALKAETHDRQQFLKQMNMRDITQYHRFYARTYADLEAPDYRPLPHLVVVVDEFAQLAREMPEFLRELVRTVQLGRSLGLHLILGTQSPMDVITDEMNANLQFRICLRVQNIEASRAMLRRPDAAYLPAGLPGRGYFQVGESGVFKQFQTAYAGEQAARSGDPETPVYLELITEDGETINLLPEIHTGYPAGMNRGDWGRDGDPYTVARSVVEVIADYHVAETIPTPPPLLLDPLPDLMTLAAPLRKMRVGGFDGRRWKAPGKDHTGQPIKPGSAPVGLMDDVYDRTQQPLWVHLQAGKNTTHDGHVLVVGGPGTGKTTFLRTLALSQALLHSPHDLHLYFISFTGTGLDDLGYLPHAETVVHGTESERLRRLFGRLMLLLEQRQTRGDAPKPLILLCIDQYEQFRDSCRETHLPQLDRLIHEGRAAGIIVALTASGLNAVPESFRSLIQQRIALQLGGPSDYGVLVGRLPAPPPERLPDGRGYVTGSPPLLCQISLPGRQQHIDNPDDTLGDLRRLIRQMRAAYIREQGIAPDRATAQQAQAPAPIGELPAIIALDRLRQPFDGALRTHLGYIDDTSITPYVLNWAQDGPHMIVTGPPGSGKTNLLHCAALAAAAQRPPERLRLLLVDFSERSLRPLADLRHTVAYVTDPAALREQIGHLVADLNDPNAQPDADCWTVVLIDDYDIVVEVLASELGLLTALRDLARKHGDGGLSIWVAGYLERTGDPLLRHLLLRRTGFAFSSKESLQPMYIRTAHLPDDTLPPGRAFVPRRGSLQIVQVALAAAPGGLVQQVNAYYRHYPAARWWRDADDLLPAPNASADTPPDTGSRRNLSLDIDTQGLIDDLLGGD